MGQSLTYNFSHEDPCGFIVCCLVLFLVGRLFDQMFSSWVSFVGRLVMCFLALPGYRELFAMHALCL